MDETIKAVASLWPLALIVLIIIIMIIYKAELKEVLLKRNVKFKKGDAEFELRNDLSIKDETKEEISSAIEIKNNINKKMDEEIKIDSNNIFEKMHSAYLSGDKESLDKIYEELLSSKDIKDIKDIVEYKGLYHHLCYLLGQAEALDKLNQLAEEYKDNKDVYSGLLYRLGMCYDAGNNFDEAIELFKHASLESKNSRQKAANIIYMCNCYSKLSNYDEAINILLTSIKDEKNNESLCSYYKELAELYDKQGEKELKAFALEKVIEYKPNDTKILFDLAYAYSNYDTYNDITLLYYTNLLKFDSNDSYGLNNIGVIYEKLQLKGLQINSFVKAIGKNNTLASANLASLYITNGFYDEAEKILKEANEKEVINKNVDIEISRLKENRESEEETKNKIIKDAYVKQAFLNKFANAIFSLTEQTILLNPAWKLNDYRLSITQDDQQINGSWKENNVEYKFRGKLNNKAIKGRLLETEYNFSARRNEFKEKGNIYIYLSDDEELLKMMVIRDANYQFDIKCFKKEE